MAQVQGYSSSCCLCFIIDKEGNYLSVSCLFLLLEKSNSKQLENKDNNYEFCIVMCLFIEFLFVYRKKKKTIVTKILY